MLPFRTLGFALITEGTHSTRRAECPTGYRPRQLKAFNRLTKGRGGFTIASLGDFAGETE